MNTSSDNVSSHTAKPLLAALTRLLIPLVRLLIHFGISYPYLIQLLKNIYVDVAERSQAPASGKTPSDSHISLITGVHRKDVRRLRHSVEMESVPSKSTSISAQLIAHWLAEKLYTNSEGTPLPLPRLAQADSIISFEGLVKSVSKGDLRPRVVLDELLRQDIVRIDEQDRVHLYQEAFIPKQGMDEKSFYFGKVIHDHLAASGANLIACDQQQPAPHIDRCVYYDGLSPSSIDILNREIEDQGMQLLKSINRKARALQKTDSQCENANQRINLGVYFYHCEEEPSPLTDSTNDSDETQNK